MALRARNASLWLLATLNPQSTCHGPLPGSTLASWCSGGLPACPGAESTRKDPRNIYIYIYRHHFFFKTQTGGGILKPSSQKGKYLEICFFCFNLHRHPISFACFSFGPFFECGVVFSFCRLPLVYVPAYITWVCCCCRTTGRNQTMQRERQKKKHVHFPAAVFVIIFDIVFAAGCCRGEIILHGSRWRRLHGRLGAPRKKDPTM